MKRMPRLIVLGLILSLALGLLAGCSSSSDPKELTVGFVPSQNASQIEGLAKPMADYLTQQLGMPVKVTVSTNYIGLVEAMKSKQVDVGFLAPFAYVMAHEEDKGIIPVLKVTRNGADFYKSQIFVRKDSGIKTLAEAKGKTLGIVDAASASGYLFPAQLLKKQNIELTEGKYFSKIIATGSHTNAVKAVINKQVDVAFSYEGAQNDVKKDIPTAPDDVAVIALTDNIPNDGVSVRAGLSKTLTTKVHDALMGYSKTEDGGKVLKSIYGITGFAEGKDEDYNLVRDMAKALGFNIKESFTPKPK